MALLFPANKRVLDSAGDAISGAKIRVYDANTTTPSAVFSDAAMTVPLTNPIPCNSSGYPTANGTTPTLVFAASANFDVADLTAGSVLLRSWEDLPALGADNATFSKDFTNSRFAIRGVGGTVYLDFGDASPDNTTGTGSLGGWLGTQADLITLNTALANIGTSTGALKENSKKLPGVIATEATTFTAAATVDIELVNSPTGVRGWEIHIWDYLQSGVGNLYARFSYDGGANYKVGAGDYYGHFIQLTAASSTATADLTEAQLELCTNLVGSATRPGIGLIRVYTPDSGTAATRLSSEFSGQSQVPVLVTTLASGFGIGAFGRATHMRLLPSAGTITGKYRVIPMRSTGDA